ncbi:MAG: acetylglutamate kinase [Actinobacteria bacterium]|nr:acetylglutamate kinase [Actinomycetota bacterium]
MTAPVVHKRSGAAVKAKTLVEALPYIRAYRGQTIVVKIGGTALEDGRFAGLVAEDLALMAFVGIQVIVVHGGGPQVSQAMSEAGIVPAFANGLRVTDEAAIEVVRRVLIGTVNGDLVMKLCGAGLAAVGLWGGDGGLVAASFLEPSSGPDLGRVGRVTAVRPELLYSLLDGGYTPVIASVAPGDDGLPLNINADAVAASIAASVGAAKLVYMTNVEGLYRDLGDAGSLVSELELDELSGMIGNFSAGMRPKAASAKHALESGVGRVHILDGRVEHALLLEVFTNEGIGTLVLP